MVYTFAQVDPIARPKVFTSAYDLYFFVKDRVNNIGQEICIINGLNDVDLDMMKFTSLLKSKGLLVLMYRINGLLNGFFAVCSVEDLN